MDEYISRETAVDAGYLSDWYISSVGDEPPVWTEAHIDELLNDFIVIPKNTKVADVQPVKHGKWETWGYVFHGIEWERCSVCGKTADISYIALLEGRIEPVTPSFCGCCGARMDLKEGDEE